MTPRPYCASAAPAPHLSFSCVKKKDGEERKSLLVPFRRGEADIVPRGEPCVAADFEPIEEIWSFYTPCRHMYAR